MTALRSEKNTTEKSGSVRNQAIYFQLYEDFITEMNLLICNCIKQDKSNKNFVSIFVIPSLSQEEWLRTLQKKQVVSVA